MATFTGIGCTSELTLDGLDMCCVEFTGDLTSDLWSFRVLQAETKPYSDGWVKSLNAASSMSGTELVKLHLDYGRFVGRTVKKFIEGHKMQNIQFVALNGHSVLHSPADKFSFQLGHGETAASFLKVPLICDFGSKDVALGGNGASLVPCGEKFLFGNADICIDLGGIAHISGGGGKGALNYDICPCTMVIKLLSGAAFKVASYDKGRIVSTLGKILPKVLKQLSSLTYNHEEQPKCNWNECIDKMLLILDTNMYLFNDLLQTFLEYVSMKVAEACLLAKHNSCPNTLHPEVLITGKGLLNKDLRGMILAKLKPLEFEVTADVEGTTESFKEAMIYAFLGLRSMLGRNNVFKSITGAKEDSISGSIHRPGNAGPIIPFSILNANSASPYQKPEDV